MHIDQCISMHTLQHVGHKLERIVTKLCLQIPSIASVPVSAVQYGIDFFSSVVLWATETVQIIGKNPVDTAGVIAFGYFARA